MGVREAKKEARRQAIEEAGLRLFLDEGYDRCSVERIAAEVGMARGTFYLYYKDKHALFDALCERLYLPMVTILESTAQLLRSSSSVNEHQFIYLRMAGDFSAIAPTLRPLMMLHFRESHSAGPSGDTTRGWTNRIEALAEGILLDARDREFLGIKDVYTVSRGIVGAVERLAWAWVTGDSRLDKDSAAIELSAVFFRGIHGPNLGR